ncbi:hypothetical protein T01_10323 [Trichinella spiralis]|uniref:Uncharacterized protein n=1 Tax=Trichinella spiralis TaxID=6334 RepID=A0A0V0ZWG7_TRISP|nr:hypothetical protein T01_10323 [Trichinella spiralis]
MFIKHFTIPYRRQTLSEMDNSLLDPGSEPFDIAQLLFTPNNGNKCFGCT